MHLELYTAAQSRGFMVEWLLNECDATYTRHTLDLQQGQHKSKAYLAIHPLGSIPALVVDNVPMIESLGICFFLADAFPKNQLAPAVGTLERAQYCQWMVYATATIEPKLAAPFVRSLSRLPEDRMRTATSEEQQELGRVLRPLSEVFERGFAVGDRFSAADVVIGSELHWAHEVGLLNPYPSAVQYLCQLKRRSAFPR